MKSTELKAVCFSVAALDFFPQLNRSYAGGNSLNQAVRFSHCGVTSSFIGALGTDEAGEKIISLLKKTHVDTSRTRVLPGKTASNRIINDKHGERFGDPGPQPIGGFDNRYTNFVIGTTLGIPNLVIYAVIVSIVVWILWNKTTFGKNLYAIGGNPEAAKVSGVNVFKTTIIVFVIAGVLYGIGGFLEAARIGSANNGTGNGYELDAIAACVVGGISFSGGVGKVSGAIVGVLLFTIISYGMTFIGLDQYYQYIIKGAIIVAAVALDAKRYIKKV